MGLNRQNFFTGFTAAAITLGSVATPTIGNAEDVTIRHGNQSDVAKMERYLQRAQRRGVEVELIGGLGDTDCFALFNEAGEEIVRVSPKNARRIVSLAGALEKGETLNPTTLARAGGGCFLAEDAPKILIRYGDNVEDMGMWVEIISNEGVNVQARKNLENPDCAAVIYRGKEFYRFSSGSVDDATMADIAIAIGQGDENHGFTKSDCP